MSGSGAGHAGNGDEVRLLANCVIGFGFSRRGFQLGLEREPHLIGCDSGSTDFGPAFLGGGRDPKSKLSSERDLGIMLGGAKTVEAPLVIGSCGGAGGAPHLEGFRAMVAELARGAGMRLKVALVHADLAPALVHRALDEGRVTSLGPVPDLTHEAIDASTAIVGMLGAGALIDALDTGADVVLAGRCADPAIYACEALRRGMPASSSWHAAKSIDKGYLATTEPAKGSPVLGTVRADHFIVEPMLPGVRCTTESVARVTMHENPDPFAIVQPSGAIAAGDAHYEQLDDRTVRVTGSRFEPADCPSIKIEGARLVGYRAIMIAGMRDPRLLAELDGFLHDYRKLLERVVVSVGIRPEQWSMRFRPYGHNAVLGDLEPHADQPPREVGLVVDVVGDTEDIAVAVAGRAGATGSRLDFTGKLGGGGNFAYPFSPNVFRGGAVYEWSVWHILDVDDERDPFRIELVEV
ncbi:MAG TPA: acyclic terpene utilization AtuA family protein [Acidimicrobiales bacterium]|nr:acyclic terpene utilization AtuA family protein [Acidimicrobiales bacterium]